MASNSNNSVIVNYATGYKIDQSDYTQNTGWDIYQRSRIEQAILNNGAGSTIIYNGLVVTVSSGLGLNITAGSGRGFDVDFSGSIVDSTQPMYFGLETNKTYTVPASSTGWIILQANIIGYENNVATTQGPDTAGDYYYVISDNSASGVISSPVSNVRFVSTLPDNDGTAFPYTYLVLAKVTSDGTDVTIDAPDSNASFRFESSLAVQQKTSVDIKGGAVNGATIGATTPSTGAFTSATVTAAPSTATSITNKVYVDPVIEEMPAGFGSYVNRKITFPTGLILQTFYMENIGGNATSIAYDFPWEFPTECFGINTNDVGTGAAAGTDVHSTSAVAIDSATFYAWGKEVESPFAFLATSMYLTAWGF